MKTSTEVKSLEKPTAKPAAKPQFGFASAAPATKSAASAPMKSATLGFVAEKATPAATTLMTTPKSEPLPSTEPKTQQSSEQVPTAPSDSTKWRVKALRLKTDAKDGESPWGDMGTLNVVVESKGKNAGGRIVGRADNALAKVFVNAAIYKGLKVSRTGKRGVQLYLVEEKERQVENGPKGKMEKHQGMTLYVFRLKTADLADAFLSQVQSSIPL